MIANQSLEHSSPNAPFVSMHNPHDSAVDARAGMRAFQHNPTATAEAEMSNLATPDLESLRYPVGRLTYEANPSARSIAGWIQELAGLPDKMRAVTSGLTGAQLDTPYRPGGWTIRQVVHHVPDSHM